MSDRASMGHAARLGIGAAAAVNHELEFISCGLKKQGTLVVPEGIRGTRSRQKESVNDGPYTVGGLVVLEPRPDDLTVLLPFILGTSGALTERLPEFYAHVSKVAAAYLYAGCKVNTARFQSQAGQNLRLTLDIQGKTETVAAFPDIASSLSNLQPYIHHQCVLTLDGESREVKTVELSIDNALTLDRFNNSQTRTELPESDRVIKLTCENPFTAYELELYDLAIAGVAGTLVYTNGDFSLTFSLANLKAPANGPEIQARNQEIPLMLEFQAFTDGDTPEIEVTNDVT